MSAQVLTGAATAANPWAAIGGQFAMGLGQSIGSPGGPSFADGKQDGSGWNVNFGSGSIDSARSGDLEKWLPYVLIVGGLLVAWRLTRKS